MSLPDKYELIRPLGAGGMGEVFLARVRGAAGFEKHCVLKRMHAHLGVKPENAAMFLQEARIVGQMTHSNIVQVFDAGQSDGELWLVMEFVDGPNLLHVIRNASRQRRPVPLGVACRIMADVCAGLSHAHALAGPDGEPLGLVHRDLSPDNILIDASGSAKVTDFGIAKVKDSEVHTQPGWTRGKYRYMSPEQLLGLGALTSQADLFVAGVVLAELLTGKHPFVQPSGEFAPALAAAGTYPPLQSVRADIPPELELLVRRALAPNPADRFPSCKAMKAALEQFIRSFDGASHDDVADFIKEVQTAPGPVVVANEPTTPMTPHAAQAHTRSATGKQPRAESTGSSSRRAPLVAMGAGLLGAALVVGGVWWTSGRRTPQAQPSSVAVDASVAVADAGVVAVAVAVAPVVEPPATVPDAGLPQAAHPSEPEPAVVAPPVAKPRVGVLELRVRPPANVYVDGTLVGETPLAPLKLSVGKHTLRFVNDDTDRKQVVDVKPGSQRLGVTLQ